MFSFFGLCIHEEYGDAEPVTASKVDARNYRAFGLFRYQGDRRSVPNLPPDDS